MPRRVLVVANWKMYGTLAFVSELTGGIVKGYSAADGVEVAVSPAHPYLQPVGEAIKGSGVRLAAQDISPEVKGAFTGDVSGTMLADVGCAFALIGHSERRQHHGEQSPILRRKLARALEARLHPIVCCGEPIAVRNLSGEEEYVRDQLSTLLKNAIKPKTRASPDGGKPIELTPDQVTVAYEPIWAVGTGEVATPDQAQAMCAFIREVLTELGGDAWQSVVIMYGGSIKPDNARALVERPDCDGLLVGGASLIAESFLQIHAEAAAAVATTV